MLTVHGRSPTEAVYRTRGCERPLDMGTHAGAIPPLQKVVQDHTITERL